MASSIVPSTFRNRAFVIRFLLCGESLITRLDGIKMANNWKSEVSIKEELFKDIHEEAGRSSHPADDLLVQPESNRQPVLSVVLPTLNEQGGVGECITRIKNALAEIDVSGEIIVSDSSTDKTPEIAASMGAIVINPDRPGYGYAYRYAFNHARGKYLAMGDADTTYDFEELPKLFAPVARGEADMVLGTRLKGKMERGSMPALHRYIGNPLLTKFLNVFYKSGVSDAHSGFRVFSRDAYEKLELRTDGMEFASEMIMVAGQRGLRLMDVPIVYHPRVGEAHLESFQDGWRHVRFMLLNAPGYLFSLPAAALLLTGVLTLGLSLLGSSIGGITFATHTAIIGSLCIVVGYQAGSLTMFSSVASNPIKRQRDPVTRWINRHFSLEHGAISGLILMGLGASYTAYLVWTWVESGFSARPMVASDMLAFVMIVLGIQTIFDSLFLSMVEQEPSSRGVYSSESEIQIEDYSLHGELSIDD